MPKHIQCPCRCGLVSGQRLELQRTVLPQIHGRHDGLSVYRHAALATARISKELMRNSLKLSTFAYVDVSNGGVFNRFSASYALNDQIEFTAGYDFFHADKGKFAMYRQNSEVWLKAKYSF